MVTRLNVVAGTDNGRASWPTDAGLFLIAIPPEPVSWDGKQIRAGRRKFAPLSEEEWPTTPNDLLHGLTVCCRPRDRWQVWDSLSRNLPICRDLTGATGLEPATSGVTGATQMTAQTARFGCLMRNESGWSPAAPSREIAAICGRFWAVWAETAQKERGEERLRW